MTIGAVISSTIFKGVNLPNGSVMMWNIPVSDTTGLLSDYFDISTGLGLDNTVVEGWAICDGQNNTIDAIGRYLRGCNTSVDNLGVQYGYSTALPTTGFETQVYNVTPTLSMSSNTAYPIGSGYYVATTTGSWSYDWGGNIGGSGDVYVRETSSSSSVSSSNTYHNHSAAFTGTTVSVGSQTVSGGDSETRPNTVVYLLITRL